MMSFAFGYCVLLRYLLSQLRSLRWLGHAAPDTCVHYHHEVIYHLRLAITYLSINAIDHQALT
jgi:hypothetical protein